ncbi:VOC family protein [Paenibacillus arenilitoris]|uniref:Glyoxalase/bleomycin resistance/dioxygenase family protein n=1 Tax=Paenibacillus arenilitoris TaxID=2772299 RepID=A0A927CIP0_9BACL|nr:VOC family protein [Paenibacillus arenilitoris]MBD2868185.1 glyoxalase/bleomycin resistance/dioxygenase family protein [Paenibacillus arenilitoris]
MDIKESGVILFLERYEENVSFYTDKLGLPVRERQPGLTKLAFGGSYLMVEENGIAGEAEKTRAQNPTVLRIEVQNFHGAVQELVDLGVPVQVRRFEWGTIGVIVDPEGNRIEIKEYETD